MQVCVTSDQHVQVLRRTPLLTGSAPNGGGMLCCIIVKQPPAGFFLTMFLSKKGKYSPPPRPVHTEGLELCLHSTD